MTPRLTRTVAAYGACHFVVDLSCVATVLGVAAPAFGELGLQEKALAVLTYDLVAFCMQLPIGTLLDALGRRRSAGAAVLSFVLTATGVLGPQLSHLVSISLPALGVAGASVLLIALGNALFHCVGGVEVLGESNGAAGPSGAFISTGAIGVFVGSQQAFNTWAFTPWLLTALLAGCTVAILMLGRLSDKAGTLGFPLSRIGWAAVAFLAATVALRSYTGMVMGFPWKSGLVLGACAVAAVVAGKAVGGFIADRLGLPLTSLISLGGAAAAFWFSWDSMAAGLAGTFLFNFTMAITLSALARLLPSAHGLAFGIASFSLAVGAFPALIGIRTTSAAALVALSVTSLVLLEIGLLLMAREIDA